VCSSDLFAIWGLLKKNVLSILAMAFIIQLSFQSDTGMSLSFMLSYLALAGMLTLGQTFFCLFRGRLPAILARALSASLGAFITTAPLVVSVFGSLKPIGIAAGLIVAPVASVFMVFSLAALAAAFLPLPLWSVFDVALTTLYNFLELVVSAAGRVPSFAITDPVPVLIGAGLLSIGVLLLKRRDDTYRNSVAAFS
jgi:competence protein ComEC